MTIELPDPIAEDAGLDKKAALRELAFALYSQERISGGQVRHMCGIGYFEFEEEANARGLPVDVYTEEAFEQDLRTLGELEAS